jgi:hypothetical protein
VLLDDCAANGLDDLLVVASSKLPIELVHDDQSRTAAWASSADCSMSCG